MLAALLERPGELVTREELRGKLWPADTFVDFDHSLNAAIKRLRDALGESAERPIFVETVARRGYRFIVREFRWFRYRPRPRPGPDRGSGCPRGAAVLGGLRRVLLRVFSFLPPFAQIQSGQPAVTPAVTNVGEKYTPSLSPDGQHLAFAWNGGAGPHFSLYVKLVGTEESLRLTKQASIDFNPVWSPDGRYIAFCRIRERWNRHLRHPRDWVALSAESARPFGRKRRFTKSFGTQAASRGHPMGSYSRILTVHHLTNLLLFFYCRSIRWKFADSLRRCVRGVTSILNSLPMVKPWPSTEVRKESSQSTRCRFREERNIVLSPGAIIRMGSCVDSRRSRYRFRKCWLAPSGSLWKISRSWGEPERLQFGQDGVEPSIRGNRLVYVRQRRIINIWRRKLNSLLPAGPPDKFISSTRMESGPQFSPDGSKIAFESTRSGAYEVWMCRSDGSGLSQLTHFNSATGTPRWSPDGQQIAFDSRPAGNADIFVIDFQGGSPRNLPMNLRTKWYQVGRETATGYITHRITLVVGSMEDAFDRWVRSTSDTSRWICSVRIVRRKIPVLCKGRPFLDCGAFRLTVAKRSSS